jgi:hypothetical protein
MHVKMAEPIFEGRWLSTVSFPEERSGWLDMSRALQTIAFSLSSIVLFILGMTLIFTSVLSVLLTVLLLIRIEDKRGMNERESAPWRGRIRKREVESGEDDASNEAERRPLLGVEQREYRIHFW